MIAIAYAIGFGLLIGGPIIAIIIQVTKVKR